MNSIFISKWTIVALLAVLPALQACETGISVPPVPATFNEVLNNNVNGIRTARRVIADGPNWQSYNHSDELDDNWCADLAVAPDGKLRYLAFIHEAPGGNWLLSIRTGLGSQTWSTTFSGVAVPEIVDSEGFAVSSCVRVRFRHLKDDLYGIVWINNGLLSNAVFDASKSPPADLVLGDVAAFPAFDEPLPGGGHVSARQLSLVWFNDRVNLVWSKADRTQIKTKTATLGASGIAFGPGASFTRIEHNELSDVIVHDGALYVAAKIGGTMRLFSTSTGGTNWQEVASCAAPSSNLTGRLLYADPAGDKRVAQSASGIFWQLNFADCSTSAFPLMLTHGDVTYHPGD